MVKAILEDESLLRNEQFVAPDIIVFEVANAIWKHEHLMKSIEDGNPYLTAFFDLIKSKKVNILTPTETMIQDAYQIAKQNNITIYDAAFIAIALQLQISIKTLDKAQIRALELENQKKKP